MNELQQKLYDFLFTQQDDMKKKCMLRRRRFFNKLFSPIKYSDKKEYNDKIKEVITSRDDIVKEWNEKNDKPPITTDAEKKKRNKEAVQRYQKKNKPQEVPLIEKMRALNLDPSKAPEEVGFNTSSDSNVSNEPSESVESTRKSLISNIFKTDMVNKQKNTLQYLSRLNVIKSKTNKGLSGIHISNLDINLFVKNDALIDKTIQTNYKKENHAAYYTALVKLFDNYITQSKSKSQDVWRSYIHFSDKYIYYNNMVDADKAMDSIKTTNFRPEVEMANYVDLTKLFSLYQTNKDKLDYYENLLISMYLKSKPIRHDLVNLILVDEEPKLDVKGNFLLVKDDKIHFYYKDTKTSSRYKNLNFPLDNPSLKRLVKKHIQDKKLSSGDYIFPADVRKASSKKFKSGMKKLTNKSKLDINLYRKIYITYLYDKIKRTPDEINKDAALLGHSVKTEVDTYYIRTQ